MSWSGLPLEIEKYVMPEPNSGCWLWLGGLRDSKDAYGGVAFKGKTYRSHRLVYILLREPLPAKVCLDHLRRNKICCNPDHMEPTTWKINIHRGVGIAPNNILKTHCPQGHAYTEENTYIWNEQRFCRTCHKQYTCDHARRKRAKK